MHDMTREMFLKVACILKSTLFYLPAFFWHTAAYLYMWLPPVAQSIVPLEVKTPFKVTEPSWLVAFMNNFYPWLIFLHHTISVFTMHSSLILIRLLFKPVCISTTDWLSSSWPFNIAATHNFFCILDIFLAKMFSQWLQILKDIHTHLCKYAYMRSNACTNRVLEPHVQPPASMHSHTHTHTETGRKI